MWNCVKFRGIIWNSKEIRGIAGFASAQIKSTSVGNPSSNFTAYKKSFFSRKLKKTENMKNEES